MKVKDELYGVWRIPNLQESEVQWYKTHGKYPDRIRREYSGRGKEFVIGDWSWERENPGRWEKIEHRMHAELLNSMKPPQ